VGIRARISQWRNQRAWDQGKRDLVRKAADQARSRIPGYRDQPNPVYAGRPHRQDAQTGREIDRTLSQLRAGRQLQARARHPSAQLRDVSAPARDQAARDRAERFRQASRDLAARYPYPGSSRDQAREQARSREGRSRS